MAQKQLVCEGGCNPRLREYEEIRREGFKGPLFPLIHTTHDRVRSVREETVGDHWVDYEVYRCVVCGTERRLGWDLPEWSVSRDLRIPLPKNAA